MRTQIAAGALLTAVGVADLAGFVPPLVDYAYPIVWWGVLLLLDAWNSARNGLSLWRGNFSHFVTITLPLSVIVWLLFEALNLRAPQWRYHTDVPGLWRKILLGFASFATVIPIMVEFWWLVAGRQCLPAGVLQFFRRRRALWLTTAAVAMVLPFINDVFWFNQGMWLIPALVLLPFLQTEICRPSHFIRAIGASGVLAGLAWEAFNYPARSHWEYLILPDAAHLFYMPLPGYVGFIPFALSMLAVYEFARAAKATFVAGVVLYCLGIAGLYGLMTFHMRTGML